MGDLTTPPVAPRGAHAAVAAHPPVNQRRWLPVIPDASWSPYYLFTRLPQIRALDWK